METLNEKVDYLLKDISYTCNEKIFNKGQSFDIQHSCGLDRTTKIHHLLKPLKCLCEQERFRKHGHTVVQILDILGERVLTLEHTCGKSIIIFEENYRKIQKCRKCT